MKKPENHVTAVLILPVYNESAGLPRLVDACLAQMSGTDIALDIILVDDGSADGSLGVMRTLSGANPAISYIGFSRNFGKENAVMAGLCEAADGYDLYAYMDSDGQHRPEDLRRLLEAAAVSDADIICGVREDRRYQTGVQRVLTLAYYRLYAAMTGLKLDPSIGDFNVLKPVAFQSLRGFREQKLFLKGLVNWIGFDKEKVTIRIADRANGQSAFSTRRSLRFGLASILSFSSIPLRAWSLIGFVSALSAVAYLLYVVADTVLRGRDVPGYATIVVLLLGLGGLQLMSVGILGEYVARIHDAAKDRPRYIIARSGGSALRADDRG